MAISRFTSRFKTRTDLMDNITPNNVVQANVSVPHGEWKPASWLPVVWQNEKSKDYFVISSGKVVSFDSSGRVVPSGLLRRCLDATGHNTVIIDYDANDKAARVIDITTGAFVGGDVSVTLRAFIKAAYNNGWLAGETLPGENAEGELEDLKALAKKFISAPVGVCAYDVYAWAGDDPANLHFTNYQKQHLIQFFTDIQMKAPQVVNSARVTEAKGALTKIDNADLKTMPRYAGLPLIDNVVGLSLNNIPAAHTSRTPAVLVFANNVTPRHRSEPSLIAKNGDWYLDDEAGILLIWDEVGNTLPDDFTSIAYNKYDDAVSDFGDASKEKMICFVGDCTPGDFVTFDQLSNLIVLGDFVVADSGLETNGVAALKAEFDRIGAAVEDRNFEESLVIGRVMDIIKEPRGLLERVKTGFSGEEFDTSAQMPGSATKGFSDLITLSEQLIADQIVVVNVKI